MGDYNRNDRGGDRGGRRFGGGDSGRRSFGGRDSGRREMHSATCAECGNSCEVPFLPKTDRPVYCSNCFEKRGNRGDNPRRSDDRNFTRPTNFEERWPYPEARGDNRQLTEQIKNLNAKLDKIISLLVPKVETSLAVKDEVTDIVLKPKTVKPKVAKKKVKVEKVETEKSL